MHVKRKAQAEFALILGLLIIAVVVAIYAYSLFGPPSVRPSALTEEQKAVDAYVKDAISRASGQTLDTIYNQGGYADLSGKRAVSYAGNKIAYWQVCEKTDIPDVEKNLELAVGDMLRKSIPDTTDIAGKRVTFDKSLLQVDAQLFDNSITMNIRLPTAIEGRPMQQPYTIYLQSRLGRISEFAKNFAQFQAQYRGLDQNLIRLIYRSNPESCWLPTMGVIFASSFYKSWDELRNCMEQLIIHNMAHTYEWEKPALTDGKMGMDMLSKSWIFEIVKSDGTWGQYKDLDVEFSYGGGAKKMSRNSPELYFSTNPSPVRERGNRFQLIRGSIGPVLAYDVSYDVSFPVVVSVWDSKLERSFKFTTFVNIGGNGISKDCDLNVGVIDEYNHRCVLNATQDMHLKVFDHNNAPLSGVDVWYDGCGPWTVFGGDLRTYIPKAQNAELILQDGFSGSEYTICIDSDQLLDKNITLPVMKTFRLNFYAVRIQGHDNYRIRSVEKTMTENITVVLTRPGNPCMNSTQITVSNNEFLRGRRGRSEDSWADLYPTEQYNAVVSSDHGSIEMTDLVADDRNLELYVYAPVVEGGRYDEEKIKSLYNACGMRPVTAEFYGSSKEGCRLP